jgi:hypothetical protein
MKKTLIPALLVVSAAFTPCLRNTFAVPERACQVAQAVAAPLFWHLWDELLDREIARWTKPATNGEVLDWRPGLPNDAVACIFFHVLLKHAFDRASSLTGRNQAFLASISQQAVRRTVEKEVITGFQYPAIVPKPIRRSS